MAIQTRRGDHSEFDPEKLLPGEWACVTKGDPDSSDGKSVYMCFEAGVVKRMSTYEDMKRDIKEATQDIQDEFLSEIQQAMDSANTAAQSANQAAEDANSAAQDANDAASSAETAAQSANQAAQAANDAADNVDDAVNAAITPQAIQTAVDAYFSNHPVSIATPELVGTTIMYTGSIDPTEQIQQDVSDLKEFAAQFNSKTLYTR